MDTGIDCQHPALRENIVSYKGFSAFAGADPCVDDNSHGTHVAGTIAAAWNTYEFISVAPKAQLVPVKVLNRDAQGFCSDLVAGIQYVHAKGVKVANMSLGFYRPCNPLQKAIKRLSDKGVIIVASAGNCGRGDEGGDGEGDPPDACDNPSQLGMAYPAAYPQAIAVGAMTKANQLAYYSLYNLEGPTVAVVAPGGDEGEPILSTVPGGYATKIGTSMAAAHVTGAAVLALQRNSKLSGQDVRSLLQSTASPLFDPTGEEYPQEQQGAGLIDVEGMLQAPQLQ